MMKIDIPYYEDNTRFSNSNIGQYIKYGPKYLRDYLDKKEDGLSTSYLAKGSMIHEYILQPDEFWEDYVILDFEVPKVKQQKDFCETYYSLKQSDPLEDDDKLLLNAYNKAYSNSKSDDKKIEEAKGMVETYSKYIEYLKINDTKKVISFADLQMLKNIKVNLKAHKLANELLFNIPETIESHNEFHINWEYSTKFYGTALRCKSLIDRVILDIENKTITLIDLKTTSNLYEFEHSVEMYDYCRQFQYYWMALEWYMKNEREIDISDYKRITYIISISSIDNNAIRVFEVTSEQLEERRELINNIIAELSWHYNENKWEFNREYYVGDGSEKLKIKSDFSNSQH